MTIRYTLVPVNETIAEKYGVHEASFFQLINDKVYIMQILKYSVFITFRKSRSTYLN